MDAKEIWEGMLSRRVVGLGSNIDAEMADRIGASILTLNMESQEEIKIIIDSNGGKVIPALKLVDIIRMSKAPVTGVVIGMCSSSAVTILQACHKRISTPHSSFVLHFTRHNDFTYTADQTEDLVVLVLRKEMRETKLLQRIGEDMILSRAKISRSELKRLMRDGNRYGVRIYAAEALHIGLIDEIVEKYELI